MAAYFWTDGRLLEIEDGAKVEMQTAELATIRKANDEVAGYVKLSPGCLIVVGKKPVVTKDE